MSTPYLIFVIVAAAVIILVLTYKWIKFKIQPFTAKPIDREIDDLPIPIISLIKSDYYKHHFKPLSTIDAHYKLKDLILETIGTPQTKKLINDIFEVNLDEYKSYFLAPVIQNPVDTLEESVCYMNFQKEPFKSHNLVLRKHPKKKLIRIESLTDPTIAYYIRLISY